MIKAVALMLVTACHCFCIGPNDMSDHCRQKGVWAPSAAPAWRPEPARPLPQPSYSPPRAQPVFVAPKQHPMENSVFTTIGLAQRNRMAGLSGEPPSFASINGFGAAKQAYDMWNHDHSKKWGIQ